MLRHDAATAVEEARRETGGGPFLATGWLLSLTLHVGVIVLLASTWTRGSADGMTGDDAFREVGIFVKAEQPSDQTDAARENAQDAQPEAAADQKVAPAETSDAEQVSSLLELPQTASAPIGPGPQAVRSGAVDVRELLQTAPGTTSPTAGLMKQKKQGSFFGLQDEATRIVFVVDRSGSMHFHNAMREAKDELLASLHALDATQQFQIIFYNTRVREMADRNQKPGLHWASSTNLTLARQFVGGIDADGGTDHMPAILRALSYGPEVVFLLTDADEPQLTTGNLHEIARRNRSGARIHCVEFGNGPEVPADNFLKRLARQQGGSYRYVDVTRFRR